MYVVPEGDDTRTVADVCGPEDHVSYSVSIPIAGIIPGMPISWAAFLGVSRQQFASEVCERAIFRLGLDHAGGLPGVEIPVAVDLSRMLRPKMTGKFPWPRVPVEP